MTWRDVQHLIVITAQMSGLHGRDIASNGAGKRCMWTNKYEYVFPAFLANENNRILYISRAVP